MATGPRYEFVRFAADKSPEMRGSFSGDAGDSVAGAVADAGRIGYASVSCGGMSIVPLTIGLALGCGGTTTDVQRSVEPGGDTSAGPVEWCTGAVALSTSSQTGVSLGNAHGCAVKTDGSVWCWGLNTTGQLGDDVAEATSVPVRAQMTVRAKAVTAGNQHTCALADEGTVWCWGRNVYGALGYETATCDAGVCGTST